MKNIFRGRTPGILITVLLTVALTLFMAILINTKLLPTKLLLLAGGVFLVFILSVFLLTRNAKKVGLMVTGSLLTSLMLVVLMIGTPYLTKAVNTLSNMTGANVEVADVGVYVKSDSQMQQLSDLSGKIVGIMDVLDRDNTEKALTDIQKEVGTLSTVEFAGLGALVDGLMQDDVDAILMNNAYLDLVAEMEGYEDVLDQMKEIYTYTSETVYESAQPSKNESWNIMDMFKDNQQVEVEEEEENNGRVFSMYISGIDTYGKVSTKSRSDVNIIATVNLDTRQVLLVSTPRDFYVPLTISNGVCDKLTHAGIYGVDVSMGTLEMLYNTKIDYYFRVNFSGFQDIIDALGGITVYSDYSFSTNHCSFSKGENHLDGYQALAFARERYSFSSGDRQRGKNQMKVIEGVINKALSPAILTGYADIMESVAGNFETSMPYDMIAEIVRDQLDKGGSWNIVTASVTGSDATRSTYSGGAAYVMIPDQATVDAAIAKMNQVKNGEILE